MKKKIFTFLLFIFLSSCGYDATYSLKNRSIYAFSISEMVLTGDRQINLKIKQLLNPYNNPKSEKEKNFMLNISSSSKKIITIKDAAGDAVKFKNKIIVKVQVFLNGENASNLVVIEDFIYNNNSDKIELRAYENQIKNNLAETAVDKIIFKLVNNL